MYLDCASIESNVDDGSHYKDIFIRDWRFSQNNFFWWEILRIINLNIFLEDDRLRNPVYCELSYQEKFTIIQNDQSFRIYLDNFGCDQNFAKIRADLSIDEIINNPITCRFLQDYLNYNLRLVSSKIVY